MLISPSLSLSKSAKASLRHSISLAPICLSGLDQSEMSIALCRPMRGHLARSAMTAAHHSPRTRPPLLAPVLAIVTPHSNISLVLLSTIYNIYYIYYLLSTPELEQEHLQQIRYLNSLILRTNRISSSFTDGETQTSHHQTFWLQCRPILIHYLVSRYCTPCLEHYQLHPGTGKVRSICKC